MSILSIQKFYLHVLHTDILTLRLRLEHILQFGRAQGVYQGIAPTTERMLQPAARWPLAAGMVPPN